MTTIENYLEYFDIQDGYVRPIDFLNEQKKIADLISEYSNLLPLETICEHISNTVHKGLHAILDR